MFLTKAVCPAVIARVIQASGGSVYDETFTHNAHNLEYCAECYINGLPFPPPLFRMCVN